MNCTELDGWTEQIRGTVLDRDSHFFVLWTILLVLSMALLCAGEWLFRPIVALVGALFGGGLLFVLSDTLSLDCEVRVIASGVAALSCAVLALCLLKTGLFVLGMFAFGATANIVFESLEITSPPPFELLGVGGWQILTVGGAAVTGAIASQLQRRWFVRIASAMVGGVGVSVCVVRLLERETDEGAPPPAWLAPAIAVPAALAGLAGQSRWRRRREKPKKRHSRDKDPPETKGP